MNSWLTCDDWKLKHDSLCNESKTVIYQNIFGLQQRNLWMMNGGSICVAVQKILGWRPTVKQGVDKRVLIIC